MVAQPDPIASGWLDLYFAGRPGWVRLTDGSYHRGDGREEQAVELFWERDMRHAYYDQHYQRDGEQIAFFRISFNYSAFARVLDTMGLAGAP